MRRSGTHTLQNVLLCQRHPQPSLRRHCSSWRRTLSRRAMQCSNCAKCACTRWFNASKEQPTRLEPTSWEPDSPYFPAWCGVLYDVGPVQLTCALPLFVRPLASRCSVQNPNGFCREHCCMFWTPINRDRVHPNYAGIWTNNCCDCAIGAPGLEPCSVCGGGLSDNTGKAVLFRCLL